MKTMLDSMMETWTNAGMNAELMLESMITQWKAAGMNPEQMLEQLKNAPAPEAAYAEQVKNLQQEILDGLDDDDDDDLDGDDDMEDPLTAWEDDKLSLAATSDISEIDEMKAISCGANLALLNGTNLNTLTSLTEEVDIEDIRYMLSEHWGVGNRVELLETLQWLHDGGHRGYWKKIWSSLQAIPREEWSLSAIKVANELAADGADPETVREYTENLVEGLSQISSLGFLDNHTGWSCATWDYGRAINLCRWGYDLGYLTKEEALDKIKKYASKIYTQYKSWSDVSLGYILGFAMWNDNPYALNEMLHGHYLLLNESKSPWQLIDWND